MKKLFCFILGMIFLFTAASLQAYRFSSASFALTTDILELTNKDYQVELSTIGRNKTSFSIRLGSYRNIEDSKNTYPGNERRWELGTRWRYFFTSNAPNLVFFGFGFDNRPEDNTITPTAELGINVFVKPIILSLIGFIGYEVKWRQSEANRRLRVLKYEPASASRSELFIKNANTNF